MTFGEMENLYANSENQKEYVGLDGFADVQADTRRVGVLWKLVKRWMQKERSPRSKPLPLLARRRLFRVSRALSS
jgi:hypothetical protein